MEKQTKPPALNHLAPKWFHDWTDALIKWLTENQILPGTGMESAAAPGGGKLLNWKRPLQPRILRPWQVYISGVDASANPSLFTNVYVKVNPASYLLGSMSFGDAIGITGLNTAQSIKDGYSVWAEMTVNEDRDITGVSIVVGKPSDNGWDNFPDPVKFSDSTPDRYQTKWRQLLAYVAEYDPLDTRPLTHLPLLAGVKALIQVTETNMRACDQCHDFDGAIVKAMIPWFAAKV